jgi:hypothetical protein
MSQQEQPLDNQFVELSEITSTEATQRRQTGNVLKNSSISTIAFEELQQQCPTHNEPEVFVNRDGDRIVSIRFQCSCGNSKTLTFEYDEE